jgi:hypothetical protein
MTPEHQLAFEAALNGESIFINGIAGVFSNPYSMSFSHISPGSGKTCLLAPG